MEGIVRACTEEEVAPNFALILFSTEAPAMQRRLHPVSAHLLAHSKVRPGREVRGIKGEGPLTQCTGTPTRSKTNQPRGSTNAAKHQRERTKKPSLTL